jgi:glucose/arabinose dehydrogenase/cytochrome c5
MRPSQLLLVVAALAPLTQACGQQPQKKRPNAVAERYEQLCSQCHGKNLEGGRSPSGNAVPSLLDDQWVHGGTDEAIAKSIRMGYPEKEMPAWGGAVPEVEIRAMVIYIREQQAAFERGQIKFEKPADSIAVKSELHSYKLDTWVGGLAEPYGLAFLDANRALVTEKKGKVFVIEGGKRRSEPVTGTPAVDTAGQAGLYDVVPHPQFAQNGWIYFAFADPKTNAAGEKVSLTKIIRGKLQGNALVSQETIYEGALEHYVKAGGVHFGGRIAFDKQGHIFFVVGERGGRMVSQDLSVPMGKIHRLRDDGRLPEGNPFANDAKALKSIWSYGHRNPQGLAFYASGALYAIEHGPRGGDELNLIEKGKNYGWPVITYGMEYNGSAMTDITAKEGMEQPVVYWVPSIAPCGMNFYTGDLFPKWKNHLFVATLAAQELRRLELKDGKVAKQEVLFKNLGRMRHVTAGPDGAIYVLFPERIARMMPGE